MRHFFATLLLLAAGSQPAVAGQSTLINIVPELVGTHELAAEFEVGADCLGLRQGAGKGLGIFFECFSGRILMTFEEPAQLAAESLVITAEVIDPDSSAILSRLPSGTFIPEEFPVLIKINDDGNDSFTFSNTWRLEIQTRDLEFQAYNTLRLFRADEGCVAPGCPFEDFTRSTGIGSFRASGSFGTFSDFIIATDLRPPSAVVGAKVQQLSDLIDGFETSGDMSSAAAAALTEKLGEVSAALDQKAFETAVDKAYEFMDLLAFYDIQGEISDGWDPLESLVSVIGILYGQAESLVFSIEDLARPQPVSRGGTERNLITNGGLEMEVTVDFEYATSLQPESLDFFAFDFDPLNTGVLDRLPAGVSVDPAFPVYFAIGADPFSRPAARGDWEVSMKTRVLSFVAGSPYRLFTADPGGDFNDATTSLGVGSLIAGAHVGRFDEFGETEFLVVKDLRPISTVVMDKVNGVETLLDVFNLDATVKAQLGTLLATAKASIMAENYGQAILDLDAFLAYIEERSGIDLNDIWRADDNRINHAGLLSARAKTLQFSLSLAKAPLASDPADVNNDGKVDAADAFLVLEKVYCPNGCSQALSLPVPPDLPAQPGNVEPLP